MIRSSVSHQGLTFIHARRRDSPAPNEGSHSGLVWFGVSVIMVTDRAGLNFLSLPVMSKLASWRELTALKLAPTKNRAADKDLVSRVQ